MPISLPETRASLILRLENAADVAAWDEFAEIYAPVVYRSARRLGLQAADAEDCVQEVLTAVANSVSRWLEREDRGTFRGWLFRIARNTAIDFLSRRKHRPLGAGGDEALAQLEQLIASPEVTGHFDWEYRREVFRRASEIVRQRVGESSWQAFYRTWVTQRSVQEVAKELETSVGSVYIARSRVMKRLRETVNLIEESNHD